MSFSVSNSFLIYSIHWVLPTLLLDRSIYFYIVSIFKRGATLVLSLKTFVLESKTKEHSMIKQYVIEDVGKEKLFSFHLLRLELESTCTGLCRFLKAFLRNMKSLLVTPYMSVRCYKLQLVHFFYGGLRLLNPF